MGYNKRDLWEFKKRTLLLIHGGIGIVFLSVVMWYGITSSEFSSIVLGAIGSLLVFFLVRNTAGYMWGRKDARNTFSEWAGEEGREVILRYGFNELCAKGAGVPLIGYWLGQRKYSALLRAFHEAYYKRRLV
jgi:hypothetical protein